MSLQLAPRAAGHLQLLALALMILVWGGVTVSQLSASRGVLLEAHTRAGVAVANAVADAVARQSDGDLAQGAKNIAGQIEAATRILTPPWRIEIQDAKGEVVARQAAGRLVEGRPYLAPIQVNGAELGRVALFGTDAATEDALQELLLTLLLALLAAYWCGTEILTWCIGRELLAPAALLSELAGKGAAGDFRRAPRPGGGDELGRLATAFGRFVHHITRRRHDLEWLAADARGGVIGADIEARIRAVTEAAAAAAQCAPDDPPVIDPPVVEPLHRLICAMAAACGAWVALGGWFPPLPAALLLLAGALLGGRGLDGVRRRLGSTRLVTLAVVIAAAGWLAWPGEGPLDWIGAAFLLAIGITLGVIVHCAGAWLGPRPGLPRIGWELGGIAGALAGIGSTAVLAIGEPGSAVLRIVFPAGLILTGLMTFFLAPHDPDGTHPGGWPGPHALLTSLRRRGTRFAAPLALLAGMLMASCVIQALAAGSPIPAAIAFAGGGSLMAMLPSLATGENTASWVVWGIAGMAFLLIALHAPVPGLLVALLLGAAGTGLWVQSASFVATRGTGSEAFGGQRLLLVAAEARIMGLLAVLALFLLAAPAMLMLQGLTIAALVLLITISVAAASGKLR